MDPRPVELREHLPRPGIGTALLCLRCRVGLYYWRADPPRYPVHFFFCRRCGSRYAAWEAGWTPGLPG